MKFVGGIVAWLGGMAILLGVLFYMMSLKNPSDLYIWTQLGRNIILFGGTLGALGGVIYIFGEWEARSHSTRRGNATSARSDQSDIPG